MLVRGRTAFLAVHPLTQWLSCRSGFPKPPAVNSEGHDISCLHWGEAGLLQRRQGVDAAMAELRAFAGFGNLVGGLLNQRAQLRRIHVAEVADDQSSKAGNVRRGHGRASCKKV